MKRIAIILLAFGPLGCTAGTATELLTFDNVIGAAEEAKKGVVAYDQAVQTPSDRARCSTVSAGTSSGSRWPRR